MEESLKFLKIPLSEGSHVSPAISSRRGNVFHLKASQKAEQGLTSGKGEKKEGEEEEEEGRTDSQKLDRIDTFDPTDWRENIKPPGDLSRIVRPDQPSPLCWECQASTRMGNQQGTKIKPPFQGYAECRAASPKSPRFQIPRKRRRRGGKPVYFTQSIPRSKLTARTLPSNERAAARLQTSTSSTFGGWNLKDDRHIFCTPTPRRKRILESQHNFEPLLGMRSLGALTADCPVSQSSPFPHNDLSANKEPSLQDSDTDQSEYDELSSVLIYPYSKEPATKTEECAWDEPKGPLIKPEKFEEEEKERKLGGKKNSTWIFSELAKKEAAERVRSKIEELEGILRQVSLNSSGQRRQEQSKGQMFNIPVREDKSLHKAFYQDTGTQLVEEFQALSEALSQSLRQVLKVEGAREEKLLATESSPLNPVLHSDHCASTWSSNTSSNSPCLPHGETLPSPPPSPSTSLDVPEETSASFEGTSPILSPILSSSHKTLTLSLPCQQGVASDHHSFRNNFVGGDSPPHWVGDDEADTRDSGGTEKENRNCFFQGYLRPSGRDQAQESRCISERDLLSSGNFAHHSLHQEV